MPDFAASLAALYDEFAVPITVDGDSSKRGIFESGYINAGGLGVSGVAPSLRVIAAEVPSLVKSSVFVIGGVIYTAKSIEPIPPDVLETRVELKRQ